MDRVKLTKTQERDLANLARGPIEFTTWGGKPFTTLPFGLTQTKLWRLQNKGCAEPDPKAYPRERWSISAYGRAYLATLEKQEGTE